MLSIESWLLIFSVISAGLITAVTIPLIVSISRDKNILDEPANRKSHKYAIPHLGGIAILFGFYIAVFLIDHFNPIPEFKAIVLALFILFFTGLKDDIIGSTPLSKLTMQIISFAILIFMGDLRFTNLHGFLGIYEISYFASVFITLFVLIVIINTFNLIDGVDGLASGIGISSSIILGSWFFVSGNYNYSAFSFSLTTALFGFFFYNVFGLRNKIFMGDTGSMILGIIISILIIKFNELNIALTEWYNINSTPAVSIGIIIIPLLDTLKVFIIRLSQGRSPFKPDKSHFHHKLMTYGFSHFGITLRILLLNTLLTIVAFLLQDLGIITLTLIICILGFLVFLIPFRIKLKI